jgi:protein-disulfide isomerase
MATPVLPPPIGPRDHARGRIDAPVVLLEYGDFECPQCARAYPIVRAIERQFGDRLCFVFRSFPLTNVHVFAQRAAEAAEWAATHDAFWPMHDAIYAEQARLSVSHLLAVARRLGLDAAGLEAAWGTHAFVRRVKDVFLGGIESGVQGTPAFFVNGIRQPAWDAATLVRAIEAHL